jgi:uncharacterized membrane protein
MSTIFYTLLFFLSISNLYLLALHSKIFKIREWWDGFNKVTKKIPQKSDYRKYQDFIFINFWSVVTIVNYVFLIVGLLTQNWLIFLSTIVISFIFGKVTKKIQKWGIIHKSIDFISIISISTIYLIVSLNHFHFGLNLSELIIGLFN